MVSLQAALAVLVLSAQPSQTVMLDFSAPWCGSCRAMESTVGELEARGYPVRHINIDQEKALAIQFQVQTIPCFVMVVDGREVDRVVGGTTYSRLERMCKSAAAAAKHSTPPAAIASTAGGDAALAAWAPRQDNPPVADATLIAASVRLRVEDPDGRSCGSGTIIDARQGEALILTCGHIFRDSKGKGPIEVDLFGPGGAQRVAGRLIAYDAEKNDVGLVSIHTSGPVVAARVAPAGCRIGSGDAVVTVGCNNGADPTAHHGRVLSVDKFMGPANLQVEGEPVEGRSGGGVFSRDGLLVGICNAADRSEHAGYCVALPTIYAELDRAAVGFVYKEPAKAAPPAALAVADPPPAPSRPMSPVPPIEPQAKLASGEQAAMDEIQRRLKEGDEVVCIIRNRRDQQGKSEVLMLDHVSREFVDQLSAKAHDSELLHPTSLEVVHQKTPILEWDAERGYLHQGAIPGQEP